MSSRLLNCYKRYYESYSDAVATELFESILDFDDFENYQQFSEECYSLCLSSKRPFEAINLRTNGSTGDPRKYVFSHFGFWGARIESFLRNSANREVIYVFDRPFITRPALSVVDPQQSHHNHKQFLLSFHAQTDQFFEAIQDLSSISMISTPNVWLYITSSKKLRSTFNNCGKICQGINTDWDIFGHLQHLNFPVKDQMIDWYTGLNFYTCESGHKHVLPLFHYSNGSCKNLLNLAILDKPCDDEFIPGEQILCECGKRRLQFEFTPHKSNHFSIDKSFISELQDTYINLQFWLIDGQIHVFRSCEGLIQDTHIIEAALGDCIFHENSVARVGSKTYNFWATGNSQWSIETMPIQTQTIMFL